MDSNSIIVKIKKNIFNTLKVDQVHLLRKQKMTITGFK